MQFEDTIKMRGRLVLLFRDPKTGRIKNRYCYKNMVVTAGKNSIAQRLSGNSQAGEITYMALGTGTVAPALADTQLQTELVRKLVSVRSYNNNSAAFQTFYTTSEGNGTLREAGLFGNSAALTASGTVNSGQLFCRTAINRTKTSSDTLTFLWYVTVG
jgi:hypothetical protein